jgi:5-methylcytosine-specific restriction endonuclease McrA
MPFNSPDSPAAQSEAFSSTIILKDYRKSMNAKKGRADLIDHPAAQIRPSTSHGEKGSKGGLFSKDQDRPSTSNGEKTGKDGKKGKVEQPVKKKKVKIGVRKDTSATGEDPPESGPLVKAITAERPYGVEIPDKVDEVDPILEDMMVKQGLKRPSTSHGEKSSEGSQSPTLEPRSSTFPEVGRSQTSKEKNNRSELQRPLTSYVEKGSQSSQSSTERDIALENRRSTLRKPVPLGELKIQRTVSFYNAHMDSPYMPPPLSLGAKKPVPSSLGPNTRPSSSIPRPTSSRGPKNPLPSDGGAFLNKPYIEPPVIKKSLRKRPSFSSLFLRKTESSPKEEAAQVVPEPDALEPSKSPKKVKPILKASKSTPALPQVKIEDKIEEPKPTPVLKTQRSFGESLRARFNMKSAEKPPEAEAEAEAETPSPVLSKKEEPVENLSYAEKIQRGELPYPPIEGWKPSYLIKDPSLPRTPRGLDSPHFDEFPKYETGTVALPVWLPQTRKQREKFEDLEGKYKQGEELDQGDKLRGRRWEAEVRALRESVGVMVEKEEKRREKRHKEKFRDLMGQQGRTAEGVEKEGGENWGAEVQKVPVRPMVYYNMDERIGPLFREVKAIVDGEPTIVAEGMGEEDQPSPSDKVPFLKTDKSRKSLRATKSMGDLRSSTQPDKNGKGKLLKKEKKEEKKEVKSSTGITPSMISNPRLISLPEWKEEIESSLSKEYTRKFLMEKAKAEKRRVGDLDPPKGPPINKDVTRKNIRVAKRITTLESVKEEGLSLSLKPDFVATMLGDSTIRGTSSVVAEGERPKQKRVRILSQATNYYGREFEEPRATPKPPKAPERRREESIFAQREEPKKRLALKVPFLSGGGGGGERRGGDSGSEDDVGWMTG